MGTFGGFRAESGVWERRRWGVRLVNGARESKTVGIRLSSGSPGKRTVRDGGGEAELGCEGERTVGIVLSQSARKQDGKRR